MLRHGRAGVPMEVMGLMLGEFVDDYTVRVIDVFAMPQSGTVCGDYMCVHVCVHVCGMCMCACVCMCVCACMWYVHVCACV